jgi:excinuclease ABC subunit C
MQELDCSSEFDAARDAECFAAVPARPAVFVIEPREELTGAKPYLLRTANLRERLKRLLGPPEPASKRLNLREFAARIRYRVAASPFELNFLHWQHARLLWPATYRERARLRAPAILKVSLTNAYPRCYATRRIGANGFYFGPFRSRRAADAFASGFLDLFKIRRCQIKIRRDTAFPGCMYSEMKMCLAPCFAGCTKEEYDAEVGPAAHRSRRNWNASARQPAKRWISSAPRRSIDASKKQRRRCEGCPNWLAGWRI